MNERKRIAVLGSTGSVGEQTIDVVQKLNYKVTVLAANKNVRRAEEQARMLQPEIVSMSDTKSAQELKIRLADTPVRVLAGEEGLLEAAAFPECDIVVTSLVGVAGLRPTLAAIDAGHDIALANKETLVCGGRIVMERARQKNVHILPVDSEHSALFQCINGENPKEVKKMILTASGGPFWGKTIQELRHISREDALHHPNWEMGAKITVDSATMMNKGLELIEAMWLYQLPFDRISIVVHRESILHSMVEFCDHSIVAQLSQPDMRLPIQYALTWPKRCPAVVPELDLAQIGTLSFYPPDEDNFRCLALAKQAAQKGGNMGAVLNGANEAAVSLFLDGKIGFLEIADLVDHALERAVFKAKPDLSELIDCDFAAREAVLSGLH